MSVVSFDHRRDSSVPTILESFPVPPTHIPSTPHSASFQIQNPPPSRPPSLPLPPVPGPSRFSEHDLLLLSSANSRPTSKYSTASSNGVGRTLSNASVAPRKYPPHPSISEEHNSLLSDNDDHSPALARVVRHRQNDSISSVDMRDLPDDDDEQVVPPFNAFRVVSQDENSLRHHLHHHQKQKQSLSITVPRVDPHTIKSPTSTNLTFPVLSAVISSSSSGTTSPSDVSSTLLPSPPLQLQHTASSATPSTLHQSNPSSPLSPQDLHRELRAARSKSINHKHTLRARSLSQSSSRSVNSTASKTTATIEPLPALPSTSSITSTMITHTQSQSQSQSQSQQQQPIPVRKSSLPPSSLKEPERSSSPDIESIISATPRPLRRQPSDLGTNHHQHSTTMTTNSFASSLRSSTARSRKGSNVSSSSLKGQSQGGLDGVPVPSDFRLVHGTWEAVDDFGLKTGGGLEQCQEDEDVGADSDGSSIDLHTPLPHLMVKHGLLSPHSKILPEFAGLDVGNSRPGSTLSIVTKSGLHKDERNTPMRKERHRDGRLLRGGIGLTTGLGWSDSEDEDAPSPLTRRLSSLNLSRRSSAISVRTTHSSSATSRASAAMGALSKQHPLSRSYSGGAVSHHNDILEEGDFVDEFGQLQQSSSSSQQQQQQHQKRPRTLSATSRGIQQPPTSWQGRVPRGSNNTTNASRISTSSAGSIGTRSKLSPSIDNNNRNSNSDDSNNIRTPSTASSTLSIPLPTTPQDDLGPSAVLTGSISRKGRFDRDKTLPPLPLQPILKKQSTGDVGNKIAFPSSRSRAGSLTGSTSSTPAPAASSNSNSTTGLARVTSPRLVRPLQLPQRIITSSTPTTRDRPPVPIPTTTTTHVPPLTPSRSVPGLSSSSTPTAAATPRPHGPSGGMSVPTSPIIPRSSTPTGMVKPKSRTGTGMAYKKSSYSSATIGPGVTGIASPATTGTGTGSGGSLSSRVRPPMPLSLASTKGGSLVPSASGVKGVSSGLAVRARAKTPVAPTTPTTPVGQAF